jgi:hypothetical protein
MTSSKWIIDIDQLPGDDRERFAGVLADVSASMADQLEIDAVAVNPEAAVRFRDGSRPAVWCK